MLLKNIFLYLIFNCLLLRACTGIKCVKNTARSSSTDILVCTWQFLEHFLHFNPFIRETTSTMTSHFFNISITFIILFALFPLPGNFAKNHKLEKNSPSENAREEKGNLWLTSTGGKISERFFLDHILARPPNLKPSEQEKRSACYKNDFLKL